MQVEIYELGHQNLVMDPTHPSPLFIAPRPFLPFILGVKLYRHIKNVPHPRTLIKHSEDDK